VIFDSAAARFDKSESNCLPHFSQTPPRLGVTFTMRSLRLAMLQFYRRAVSLWISNGTTTKSTWVSCHHIESVEDVACAVGSL